jgi:hypothetical protein
MRAHRRQFLRWLGGSTLLAATGRGADAQAHAEAGAARVKGADRSPVSDEWDMSWVEKISGAARAVFDVPTPGEGEGVWRAGLWREDYQKVYGSKPGELTAVLVIRHEAIPLIMDNDYWKRFEVGKKLGIKGHDSKKWTVANPVSSAHDGAPKKSDRYTIESFLANGGLVLACNMAFLGRVVSEYGKADDLSSDDAYARAREHIVPGVILQPSGVFAALRAQQAGCAYILAS